MFSAKLSVLIPTYNRKDVLRKALVAYCSQSAQQEILEIFVVDDGSTDGTESAVVQFNEGSSVPVHYFRQDHRGAGAARNLAIREARGALLLFTDDDVIPSPTLVEEHLKWHLANPDPCVAVLGPVPWHPDVHPTPFMNWLVRGGPMLNLRECLKRGELGFVYFATGNLSAKAEFLRKNGVFDEDFRAYGYEDLELGYRLARRGLRLLYNPSAVGYHYKYVSFADVCRRAQLVAAAEEVLRTKEAGVYFAEMESKRQNALKSRMGRVLARRLRPVLALLSPLLDTRIPLPWVVYQAIYSSYRLSARRPAEAWIPKAG
jgi:glycosyltransferase involved in cell wall biosynthesis